MSEKTKLYETIIQWKEGKRGHVPRNYNFPSRRRKIECWEGKRTKMSPSSQAGNELIGQKPGALRSRQATATLQVERTSMTQILNSAVLCLQLHGRDAREREVIDFTDRLRVKTRHV